MIRISKFLTFLILLVFLSHYSFSQQTLSFTGNYGKAGFNIEKQSSDGIQLSYSVTQINLGDMVLNGKLMKTIQIPGVFLPNNEGAPDLPGTGRYIAIPSGSSASLEIMEMRTEVIHNLDIAPAPRIPKETEDGLFYPTDSAIYGKDSYYPFQPVMLSTARKIRGVDVVMLGFTPFQYNPVTKDLIVYKDIRVKINFSGGNGRFGDDRLRSRWFDPLLQDMLLNPGVMQSVDYNKSTLTADQTGCEYLIIVPDAPFFKQWADSIRLFRQQQGISTLVKTLSEVGGNNSGIIEAYLNNAYNTWAVPPVACLLIGDYGDNINNTIDAPIWNSYCVSDNIYGDVDGDGLPDIIMARMTAQDENQLRVMVRKFIDYERTPPTSPGFYNHPITALGWQTERWFQLCSEVIRGYWQNSLGKSPVRVNAVYSGDPAVDPWSTAPNTNAVINYFGPSGLNYITATPQGTGGFTGGTPEQVNDAINQGSFMLQHRDHGFEYGWGEPSYTSSYIDGLHNTDLCFIMSVNCLTGKYNYSSEVFAEKFHRYTYNDQPSGALGLLAASEISYSFVNDAFMWGVYDNMWPGFMPEYGSNPNERGILPAFGNAAGKYFLEQSSWPYNIENKEVTYHLFHHHGDAFLSVYSEVPQPLTITYNTIIYPGVTNFEVTANAGALICLSLNGEILGTGIGTGAPVSITIPGNQLPGDIIKIVATLQNYYRHEGQIMVIPPSGPYIVKEDILLIDSLGNNNNQPDFGETLNMNVLLKNVGNTQANNITLNLQYSGTGITLLDNTENVGNVPANSSVMLNAAFSLVVDSILLDGQLVQFTLVASDGTETWNSPFSLQLRAPVLSVSNIEVSDPLGNNNHRIDPGETVSLNIINCNKGHSDALNTIGTLTIGDPQIALVEPEDSLGVLGQGNCEGASFILHVPSTLMPGDHIPFTYTSTSGNYQTSRNFVLAVGNLGEDWECNGFNHYNWVNSASAWVIDDTAPYEGIHCARSGIIGNNALSTLSVSMDVLASDSVSFFRKISSEADYDFLQFRIDNTMMGQWSGEASWNRVAYPVIPGNHTFSWTYVKDQYAIGGMDAAWIDFIDFPPYSGLLCISSVTADPPLICLGSNTQLSVTAEGGLPSYTFKWAPTAGLSDSTIANPVASPLSTTVYSVSVSDLHNITQTKTVTVTVDPCTGFEELSKGPYAEVFPNPTDGILNIHLNNTGPQTLDLRITNSLGKTVNEFKRLAAVPGTDIRLDLRNQPGGLYVISIETAGSTFYQKIIIMGR